MKKSIYLLIVFTAFFSCTKKTEYPDYTQYVNPFIGTAFTGHTFPGACYPLGMMQPGPQTGNFSWDYCAGYIYTDTLINGFSQNRLSGTGGVDLGDLLVQPFSGNRQRNFDSRYDKQSEKATPGYYEVKLTDNEVAVKVTASPHVAFYQYKFAKNKQQNVFIDFQSGLVGLKEFLPVHVLDNNVTIESDRVISGYTRRTRWVEREYHFVIEFDRSIIKKELLDKKDPREKAPRYVFSFNNEDGDLLNMKIAMSSTSVENAKQNMKSEISDWDFNRAHKAAKNEWNKYLSRIKIEGTNDQKVNFYTSLYHLYIQPNNIADVSGTYIGPNKHISQSTAGKFYSTWSQWDIFRAAFPLYTILSPELIPDFINSMLDFSEQQGNLPVWSLWGQEAFTMIANHSVPMVVDAYLKGFEGFDVHRAYNEVKKSLTQSHKKSNWEVYDQYKYYPFDSITTESVSRTLESGYNDYCAGLMAEKLNFRNDYDFFKTRAGYYKNLYDPTTGYMRGKDSNGNMRDPFDPFRFSHGSTIGGDYTEGNATQYSWHVLHDIPELISLMGGNSVVDERLDSLFYTTKKSDNVILDATGFVGQYVHGNEPCHHIAYLYTYIDKHKKTHELVNHICNQFYKNKPDGLIGNDDCGQMSAWYIFSVMGFYPVDPVSAEFVLGAPQIQSAEILVGKNKVFKMQAINYAPENIYVDKVELNGKLYTQQSITYKDIMHGAELVFYMTNKK